MIETVKPDLESVLIDMSKFNNNSKKLNDY